MICIVTCNYILWQLEIIEVELEICTSSWHYVGPYGLPSYWYLRQQLGVPLDSLFVNLSYNNF